MDISIGVYSKKSFNVTLRYLHSLLIVSYLIWVAVFSRIFTRVARLIPSCSFKSFTRTFFIFISSFSLFLIMFLFPLPILCFAILQIHFTTFWRCFKGCETFYTKITILNIVKMFLCDIIYLWLTKMNILAMFKKRNKKGAVRYGSNGNRNSSSK